MGKKEGCPQLEYFETRREADFSFVWRKARSQIHGCHGKDRNQIITAGDSRNERKTPGPGLSQQNTFKMINYYYSYVNPNRICQTILSYQVQRRGASKPVEGVPPFVAPFQARGIYGRLWNHLILAKVSTNEGRWMIDNDPIMPQGLP